MKCVGLMLVALAACGRVGFDPLGDGGSEEADARTPDPIAFVQATAGADNSSATATVAFDTPVGAGHLVIAAIDLLPTGATFVDVTDTQGNTYGVAGMADGIDGVKHVIAYTITSASGPLSITSTLTSAQNDFHEVRIHEYGDAPVDPFDAFASATGTTQMPGGARSGTITTTAPNELLFAFLTFRGGGTLDAPLTTRSTFDGDATGDQVAATPGTYEAIGTLVNGSSWVATIVAFRGP